MCRIFFEFANHYISVISEILQNFDLARLLCLLIMLSVLLSEVLAAHVHTIKVEDPKHGGALCPKTTETQECNAAPCPAHCEVSSGHLRFSG